MMVLCLVLLCHVLQTIDSVIVQYRPKGGSTYCSLGDSIYVGTTVTYVVTLPQPGTPVNVTFKYNDVTRTLSSNGSRVTFDQLFESPGSHRIFVSSEDGQDWTKRVNVTNTLVNIDAGLSANWLLPGERFSGIVRNVTAGATYSWHVKQNTEWTHIGDGTKVYHQINATGVAGLLVALGGSGSACRKVLSIEVKNPKPIALFNTNNVEPVLNTEIVATIRVINSSIIGETWWTYDSMHIASCTSRSKILKYQTFQCRFFLNSFTKSLIFYLKPDNTSYSEVGTGMYPITRFDVYPKYAQKDGITNIQFGSINGNYRYYKWLNIRGRKDGPVEVKEGWWTRFYFLDFLYTQSISAYAYNMISQFKDTKQIEVVDATTFQIVNNFTKAATGDELVVHFGSIVQFYFTNRAPTASYTWSIPNITTTASAIKPNNSDSRIIVFHNASELNPNPWSFTFSVRPKMPHGPYITPKRVRIFVYEPISGVKSDDIVPLITGDTHIFNISWSGSLGTCTIIKFVKTTGQEIVPIAVDHHLPNTCTITFTVPNTPGGIDLKVDILNKANTISKKWAFTAFYIITSLSITQHTELAQGLKYSFEVIDPTPDTGYNWYLVFNETDRIKMGNTSQIEYTIPEDLQWGIYKVMVNATGKLFRGNSLSSRYSTKVVSKDLLPRISSSVILNVTEESINLWVVRSIPNATNTWYTNAVASSLEEFLLIGNGAAANFSLPLSITENTYTIKLVSNGYWVYQGRQEENLTFDVCFPAQPVVTPSKNRTLLISNYFFTSVDVETTCILKHNWNFSCSIPLDPNCDGNGEYRLVLWDGIPLARDAPSISVPPGAFRKGSYILKDEMRIRDRLIYNVSISVRTVYSPLVPFVIGGQEKTIGYLDNITLDATQTTDPDALNVSLLFKWDIANVYCFRNQDNINAVSDWGISNGILSAFSGCLQVNATYLMTVYVKRDFLDAAIASFSQEIHVKEGSFLSVSIISRSFQIAKTNSYNSKRTSKFIIIQCQQCVMYSWTVTGAGDGRPLMLNDTDLPLLIIPEDTLDGVQSYILRLIVEDQDGRIGSSSLTIPPNRNPINGTCLELQPTSGYAMDTDFLIGCYDWEDVDSLEDFFIYVLVVGKAKVMYSRSYSETFKVKLPPGEEGDEWRLPIEVWVVDAVGGITVAIQRSVIVKVKSSSSPALHIQKFILDDVEKSLQKNEKVKTLSLIIGSALFLLHQEAVDVNKVNMVNKLASHGLAIQPDLLTDVHMIVKSTHLLRRSVGLKDVETATRSKMLTSFEYLTTFSKILARRGLVLAQVSQKMLVELLSDNFEYENIYTPSFPKSENSESLTNTSLNHAALQNVYELIAIDMLTGEQAKHFETPAIDAEILKVKSNHKATHLNSSIGRCSFTYNFNLSSRAFDVIEIRECSTLNPYLKTSENSSILSLSFQDSNNDFQSLNIRDLPASESVLLNIPTHPHADINHVYELDQYEMLLVDLKKVYSGKENTALYINVVLLDAEDHDKVLIHWSFKEIPVQGNDSTVVKELAKGSEDAKNTFFVPGSEYSSYDSLYFGMERSLGSFNPIKVMLTIRITTCQFWNITKSSWDGTGCYPLMTHSKSQLTCKCNHLTSFGAGVNVVPNRIDFTVLKNLDVKQNPIMMITLAVVLALYVILMFLARRKDLKEERCDHVIRFIGSEESFYQYEIRIKTGMYPFAGTSAKVGIQIFGTKCVTKTRILKSPESFQRNSLDIFRIALDQSIGKIHKIKVRHDSSGTDPDWYLERVVIKSLVDGEKFFFFCNKWIGIEHGGNDKLENEFHVANHKELQHFTTIFFDMIGRCLNDFHLWFSIFERPKYSKFTRQQRLTCAFTFVLSWMTVNLVWFDGSDQSTSLWSNAFSLQEVVIGFITIAIVSPLNLFILLLFRKSQQQEIPSNLLKIWKTPKRVHLDFVDIPGLPEEADEEIEDDFIPRRKKVKDIHELLLHEKINSLPVDGEDDDEIMTSPSTEVSSESSIRPLLLPHTFNESTESSPNVYKRFDKWKVEHFGTAEVLHEFTGDHLAHSCTMLKQDSPILRRTHSARSRCDADDIPLLLLSEEHDEDKEARKGFTNITERVQSANKTWTSLVEKNEKLAKKLNIPDIIEYDASVRWYLPYWCVHIAYICCLTISLFCCTTILAYGQQFGREFAMRWLKILLFSFAEDIICVYPFLIILVSAFAALFIKPIDLDQIDHIDFKICASAPGQSNVTETFEPITEETHKSIQQMIASKKKRRNCIKDIFLQIILCWLVWMIVVNNSITLSICNEQYELAKLRFGNGYLTNQSSINLFQYWEWFDNDLLPSYYTTSESQPTIDNEGPWQLISPPIIYQTRRFHTKCSTVNTSFYDNIMRECYLSREFLSKESDYFLSDDIVLEGSSDKNRYHWELRINNGSTSFRNMFSTVLNVQSSTWIDGRTRELTHLLIFYNPDIQLYAYFEHTLSISSGGYQKTKHRITFFNINNGMSSKDIFVLIAIAVILVSAFLKMVKKLIKHWCSLKHILRFWWLHLICWMVLVSAVTIMYPKYLSMVDNIGLYSGNVHQQLKEISLSYSHLRNILALLVFIIHLRWIRCLQCTNSYWVVRHIVMANLLPFTCLVLVHAAITMIFSHPVYLICNNHDEIYSTFLETFKTLFFFRSRRTREDGDPTHSLAAEIIHFVYLCYTFFFAMYIFKPLALSTRFSKRPKDFSTNSTNMFGWMTKYLKKLQTKIHPKSEKHVHFLETENKARSNKSSARSPAPALPPLPYSDEYLDARLHSAIEDLNSILAISEWQQEFYNHFEKRFRSNSKNKIF